jgi:hypothetical protein
MTAGLQSLWYETADSWNERTSWVRYQYANGSMERGWSLWGKAYFGQINRDSKNTLAVLGNSFTYDTSYRQNYGGLQIGGDFAVRDGNDGAWLFGALAGYNKSNMDFAVGSDRTQISVVNLGAYVSYITGPLFADLLIKDDIAKINSDLPSVSGLNNADANSIGAQVTVGGRFGGNGGRRLVIEPMGTLAYVRTSIGNLAWPGVNFDWQNGASFRATLALRLSADFAQGQTTLQPFILGGIGQEFNGDDKLILTSGGNSLVMTDKPIKTFAVASLGLNILGTGGWSGFIRGDGLFATDYRSGAIRVGIRYAVGQ